MKKWKVIYWIVVGIVIVLFYVPAFSVVLSNPNLSELGLAICRLLVSIGSIIWLLATILVGFISLIARSVHNIKKCDDEIFEEIDKYRRRWGERNDHYIMYIQKINFLYRENGEVEKLVQNKALDRLYKRMDFLNVQNNLYEVLMSAISSLGISVLASILCTITMKKNEFLVGVVLVLTVLSFFVVILYRYNEKGQMGSFDHFIYEYEKKLLMEKIEKLERSLTVDEEEIDILETKHIIINALIDKISKKKSKKNKKQLEADIETVEALNLYVKDYNKYVKREITVNGKTCYLLYEKQVEKDKNKTSVPEFANKAYKSLNEILKKYKLM